MLAPAYLTRPRLYFLRGLLCMGMGNHRLAIKDYMTSLEADPTLSARRRQERVYMRTASSRIVVGSTTNSNKSSLKYTRITPTVSRPTFGWL
jgi:hypothetical protein